MFYYNIHKHQRRYHINQRHKTVTNKKVEKSKQTSLSRIGASSKDIQHSSLAHNIILNPNKASAFTHIEVTPKHINLSFNAPNETYKEMAMLLLIKEQGFEVDDAQQWRVPLQVKNMSWCGAGYVVTLDREAVVENVIEKVGELDSFSALEGK